VVGWRAGLCSTGGSTAHVKLTFGGSCMRAPCAPSAAFSAARGRPGAPASLRAAARMPRCACPRSALGRWRLRSQQLNKFAVSTEADDKWREMRLKRLAPSA